VPAGNFLGSAPSVGKAIAPDLPRRIGDGSNNLRWDHYGSEVSDQQLPLDALGYLGGLFEARFYEPHSTTDDPRDEIREAASLYGLDLAMMMSIAKVESDFKPRAQTGSYKGAFST
jgi:hypothetical protein